MDRRGPHPYLPSSVLIWEPATLTEPIVRAPNRLTYVVTALTYGGAEQQVATLASRFPGRGWKVQVISMVRPEAHQEELEAAGVSVISLDMRPGIPDPRALIRLSRIIRRSKPHVLHSHMVHANLLARSSRVLGPTPVLISTAHNVVERHSPGVGRGWKEIAYRVTDPLCDLTTNISHAGVDRYVALNAAPAQKIRRIPNGIDLTLFAPNPEARAHARDQLSLGDRLVLLAVGRFETQKDHSSMLKAFSRFVRDHPKSVLLLVGQGPLEDSIREEVRELGLGDSVRFLGIRNDVSALMNAADVYVMSSRWEGLPIVLLEASAAGLPIVATDVGGNAEVVDDGVSGFLVPAERPERLAEALDRVAAMSERERERLGTAGRERTANEYGIEQVVDVWESIYLELLARGGRRPRRWSGREPRQGVMGQP